jgi:hypothetical protein
MAINNHNYYIIVGAIKSLTSTISHSDEMRKLMSRELNRIRPQLAITALSVILIAVPMFLIWSPGGIFAGLSVIQLSYGYVGFSCNSFINFFVYIIFNREFRHRIVHLFGFRSVVPITSNVVMTTKSVNNNTPKVVAHGPLMK